MSKALSVDLRIRVLAVVAAGLSHRQAGERFGVSAASVSRWRRLERDQGDARPGPLGGDRRSHGLEQHGATILEIIAGIPAADMIRIPERRRFTGTQTTTPAEGFCSTLCHELVHWSGVKERLDRDLSGRFGSESYAAEELVAELGAAFLCGDLGITPEPRADHAQYIAHWLKILKDDKKAVFTAASKASEAANWLLGHEPGAA